MILDIVYYGNDVLREEAKEIENIDESIIQLAEDLVDTMREHGCIGFAAPQVGASVRMFVSTIEAEIEDEEEEEDEIVMGDPVIYINPVLSNFSSKKESFQEGNPVLPDILEDVSRSVSVTVTATDLEGKLFVKHLTGLAARVVMHENDHLNGILFIDHLDKKKLKKIDVELRNIKNSY